MRHRKEIYNLSQDLTAGANSRQAVEETYDWGSTRVTGGQVFTFAHGKVVGGWDSPRALRPPPIRDDEWIRKPTNIKRKQWCSAQLWRPSKGSTGLWIVVLREESGLALRLGKFFLPLVHMALLAWMSLGTRYPVPVESLFRKVGTRALHGLGYFLLAILLAWAGMANTKRGVVLALLAAFSYGLVLEIAQIYVPGREFSGVDILVNLGGSTMGALTFLTFLAHRSQVRNQQSLHQR